MKKPGKIQNNKIQNNKIQKENKPQAAGCFNGRAVEIGCVVGSVAAAYVLGLNAPIIVAVGSVIAGAILLPTLFSRSATSTIAEEKPVEQEVKQEPVIGQENQEAVVQVELPKKEASESTKQRLKKIEKFLQERTYGSPLTKKARQDFIKAYVRLHKEEGIANF